MGAELRPGRRLDQPQRDRALGTGHGIAGKYRAARAIGHQIENRRYAVNLQRNQRPAADASHFQRTCISVNLGLLM